MPPQGYPSDAMRRNPLSTSRLAFAALAALLLHAPAAHAAFFAVSRAISRADSALEKGIRAEEEGRHKEAFDHYDEALSRFADLRRDHPDARPGYVEERIGECRTRMLAIFAAADRSNQPEDPLPAIPVGEPETDDLPQNEVAPLAAPPRVSGPAAPTRHPIPKEGRAPVANAAADAFPRAPADPAADDPGAPLDVRVEALLAANRAAEAVLLMDAAIGDDLAEVPLVHGLLLARSLIAAGNVARAIVVLDGLSARYPGDPAVLSLTAGAHFVHGNTFSAVRVLDELVRRHPRYADAYIDLAYTRFAMDPDANRDEAVLYYKHALAFGAARDPRLEAELGVTVLP